MQNGLKKRYLNPQTGQPGYNANFSYCYINVKGGTSLELTVNGQYFICLYDISKTFLGSTTDKNFTTPNNAYYIGISFNTDEITTASLIDKTIAIESNTSVLLSDKKVTDFTFVDNKYKKISDGNISTNNGYCYTDIMVKPNSIISLNKDGYLVTLFDENWNFISGSTWKNIKVPNNAINMTISLPQTDKDVLSYEIDINKIIVTTENYTSLKKAVDEANNLYLPIELHSGIYDVSSTNNGLYVNTSIYGIGNPTIICDIETFNVNFSPINLSINSENIVIDGVNVVANNCRYCIHDEMGAVDENIGYIHKITNCHLKCDSRSIRPIGVGLGGNGRLIIENCLLEHEGKPIDFPVITIHSGYNGQTKNSYALANNCVCKNGTILMNEEGQYEGFTNTCIVSNCLVKSNVQFETTNNKQIEFYEYNNTVIN